MNYIQPEPLLPGDKVIIVSPSGAVDPDYVVKALPLLESWGLQCEIAPHALRRLGRFCGTVAERLSDLQAAMDDKEAKAILCSRGGYGVVHLLEELDFTIIKKNPKWLIGYSDITALHSALFKNGILSLHAPMVKHLALDATAYSTEQLKCALFEHFPNFEVEGHSLNQSGRATGRLFGGNLSVLCALMGTPYMQFEEDIILFIEDIGEKPYQIDRMIWQLKLAGVFHRISGLIVGQFTDYEEDPQMYAPVYESIKDALSEYSFPICFDFPVGHVPYNYPLVHGSQIILDVRPDKVHLVQS